MHNIGSNIYLRRGSARYEMKLHRVIKISITSSSTVMKTPSSIGKKSFSSISMWNTPSNLSKHHFIWCMVYNEMDMRFRWKSCSQLTNSTCIQIESSQYSTSKAVHLQIKERPSQDKGFSTSVAPSSSESVYQERTELVASQISEDILQSISNVFNSDVSSKEKTKFLKNVLREEMTHDGSNRISSKTRIQIQNATGMSKKYVHNIIAAAKTVPGIITPSSKIAFLEYMQRIKYFNEINTVTASSNENIDNNENIVNRNDSSKVDKVLLDSPVMKQGSIQSSNTHSDELESLKRFFSNLPKHKKNILKITGWSQFQLNQQLAYYFKFKYPMSNERKEKVLTWYNIHKKVPRKHERQQLIEESGLSTYQISGIIHMLEDPPGKITADTKNRIQEWIKLNGVPKTRKARSQLKNLLGISMKQLMTQLDIQCPKGKVNQENKQLVYDYLRNHCEIESRTPSQEERSHLQKLTLCNRKQVNYMISLFYKASSHTPLKPPPVVNYIEHCSGRSNSNFEKETKSNFCTQEVIPTNDSKHVLHNWMKVNPGRVPSKVEREELASQCQMSSLQIYHYIYRNKQKHTPVTQHSRDFIESFIKIHKRVPDRYDREEIMKATDLSRQQIATIIYTMRRRHPDWFQ